MNEFNHETRKVQDYEHILDGLRRGIPDAEHIHIAGGAVRDTLLDRRIKDVDIFLDDAHGDDAAALLRSGFGYVKVGQWVMYEGFSDPMVARVAKFEKADETIPVCLIGLKRGLSIEENIARFDFGICMAAWDGGARMLTDDRFKHDAEGKTFTLTRADDYAQFSYSMSRVKKLTADRYAGWKLTVPSCFESLAREHAFRQHWYIEGYHFGIENGPQLLRPKERS